MMQTLPKSACVAAMTRVSTCCARPSRPCSLVYNIVPDAMVTLHCISVLDRRETLEHHCHERICVKMNR